MAEQQQTVEHEEEPESAPGYKAPAQVSMQELLSKDAEDESLRKYKASLGITDDTLQNNVFFPDDPRKVIFKEMILLPEKRDPVVMALEKAKGSKPSYVIKEGTRYQIKFKFNVQREIVSGLKYVQKVSKAMGMIKHTDSTMIGSFAPQEAQHECLTPMEEAPTGSLARGKYAVKSVFKDDDNHNHLEFEWQLEIKKDWE